MMIRTDDYLRPIFVTPRIAGKLLGLEPPTLINRARQQNPEAFPNATKRLFAVEDLDRHPWRRSRPITAMEILRIDCDQADQRARWRNYNERKKLGQARTYAPRKASSHAQQ
jgi:hypothetical protein